MTSIKDSSAVREKRVLPQHQAALTLIQGHLGSPSLKEYRWLDLACGRGQIIAHLADNLTQINRRKIHFHAYDVDQSYVRDTRALANDLGFLSLKLDVGELSKFDRLLDDKARFDFISLTNTVHELSPVLIAKLVINAIQRLTPNGTLFIYDMERIDPLELGAIPWSRDEVRFFLFELLDRLNSSQYRPEVSRWQHSNVTGWNVQLDRKYIELDQASLSAKIDDAINFTGEKINQLLRIRLGACKKALTALTDNAPETADEYLTKDHLLHELWAITRALEPAS